MNFRALTLLSLCGLSTSVLASAEQCTFPDSPRTVAPQWICQDSVGSGQSFQQAVSEFVVTNESRKGNIEHSTQVSNEEKESMIQGLEYYKGKLGPFGLIYKVATTGVKNKETKKSLEKMKFVSSLKLDIQEGFCAYETTMTYVDYSHTTDKKDAKFRAIEEGCDFDDVLYHLDKTGYAIGRSVMSPKGYIYVEVKDKS